MKNSLEVVSFPARTLTNIATYFLKQNLSNLLHEEQSLASIEKNLLNVSQAPHVRINISAIVAINEKQIQRIKLAADALGISLFKQPSVPGELAESNYLRAVNEDSLPSDGWSGFSHQQSRLVSYYEEALNFVQTLANHSAEEYLKQALSDAKKANFLLKRAGIRLVNQAARDAYVQHAVMT